MVWSTDQSDSTFVLSSVLTENPQHQNGSLFIEVNTKRERKKKSSKGIFDLKRNSSKLLEKKFKILKTNCYFKIQGDLKGGSFPKCMATGAVLIQEFKLRSLKKDDIFIYAKYHVSSISTYVSYKCQTFSNATYVVSKYAFRGNAEWHQTLKYLFKSNVLIQDI